MMPKVRMEKTSLLQQHVVLVNGLVLSGANFKFPAIGRERRHNQVLDET